MTLSQRILLNLLWGGAYQWLLNNAVDPLWWQVTAHVKNLGAIPDVEDL